MKESTTINLPFRNKDEFNSSFLEIRQIIAQYINLYFLNAEGLFLTISDKDKIEKEIAEFFKERDEDEVFSLLNDLGDLSDTTDALEKVFSPIFCYIYKENIGTNENPVNVTLFFNT